MNSLSILDIVYDTTVDGPGFRTAIYAAGCEHQCAACHNPQSWNRANGKEYTINELLEKIGAHELANVSFSGGDPLFQAAQFTKLAQHIKAETTKNIWCYTGFTYEEIEQADELCGILSFIDVLVDGKYIDALRDDDLPFRGSSNQRIIDVQASIVQRKVVLLSPYHENKASINK